MSNVYLVAILFFICPGGNTNKIVQDNLHIHFVRDDYGVNMKSSRTKELESCAHEHVDCDFNGDAYGEYVCDSRD